MTTDMSNHDQSNSTEARQGRKTYNKPDFEFERVFETMALSCGKLNPTQGSCKFVRKTS